MAENGLPVGHLIQADNKKLYGMSNSGGQYGGGVLFEWDPATGTYSKKLDFELPGRGVDPEGSLLQASNGKLYGMTRLGGVYGRGVLFEWDLATEVYNAVVDFKGEGMGSYPIGTLIQAKNGKIYGMTPSGGEPDEWGMTNGVIFEWDPVADSFAVKVELNTETGSIPTPSLTGGTQWKIVWHHIIRRQKWPWRFI